VQPARRLATRDDLDALAPGVKGEIIDGTLYTMTRPRARHQRVTTLLGSELEPPFDRGRGGPGGWWILIEPGIELPAAVEISPDLAGWRRERMPVLPDDAPITVVPDWVCEVLSSITRRHDLTVKKPFYARVGVRHLWLVDLDIRVLIALQLQGENWLELGTFTDEREAQIPPFDAVSLDLTQWFPPD
jgi:Uma2 family endonuclease